MNIQISKELMALLTVCFLDTIVLAYIILRSRWAGWRLIATVFFVFYGVMTFMSQIESAGLSHPATGYVAASLSDGRPHCRSFLAAGRYYSGQEKSGYRNSQ